MDNAPLDILIDTARWFGDAEIPDLPSHLQRVPGFRLKPEYDRIPEGWRPTPGEANPFEDVTWRPDYFGWKEEFLEYRDWRRERAARDPRTAREERKLCFGDGEERRGCPKYFGAMYAMIEEPRVAGQRGSTIIPFVPYAFQLHQTDNWLKVILLPFEEEVDTWDTKSRGLGVSWNRTKDDVWAIGAIEGARILVMSRNQKFVDDTENTDALFQKFLMIHSNLPDYLRYPVKHTKNLIRNTGNRAQYIGAPTTSEAGRAGRYLFGFIDEAAKVRNLVKTKSSLAGSAKKLFFASTEDREFGPEFIAEWQGALRMYPQHVWEWNWHQNPTMNLKWEQTVLARATTGDARNKVMLEYFRDVWAGSGAYIYPEAGSLPDADYPYDPRKPLVVCTDPGKEDDVAFTVGQTTISVDGNRGFHFLFSYQKKLADVEWMAHVRTGLWPQHGDKCHGMEPSPDERIMGQFFYERWRNGDLVLDFMDPYGEAALAGYSYKNMLYDVTARLRQREIQRLHMAHIAQQAKSRDYGETFRSPSPSGIDAATGALKKMKTHHQRRLATRTFLPYFTFQAGVMSASWVRTCLQNYRFKEMAGEAVTEPKPAHDQFSHIVSDVEFTMIYYYSGWADPEPPPGIPKSTDGRRGNRVDKRNAYTTRHAKHPRQREAMIESIGNRYPIPAGSEGAW